MDIDLLNYLPSLTGLIATALGGWFALARVRHEIQSSDLHLIIKTLQSEVSTLTNDGRMLRKELNEIRQSCYSEIAELKAEYESKITELKREYEMRIDELVEENKQLRDRIRHLEKGRGFGRL